MLHEKHDLLHEFPEHLETIHRLKTDNTRFARLFDEYHVIDHEVHRIETGVENTADDYLELVLTGPRKETAPAAQG